MEKHAWLPLGLVLVVLAGCGGGGGTTFADPPPPTQAPPGPSPVPFADGTARAVVQGALLAEQSAVVLVAAPSGPSLFARRRAAAARTAQANVACSSGYAEQDTPVAFGTHAVISLYFDPACTSLRQAATLDFAMGVDTSTRTGTITSYDASGKTTAVQSVDDFWFASGGGFIRRVTTDAASAGATPFGHTTLFCTAQCTLAAVTDGAAFETGVLLNGFSPPATSGSSVNVAFSGSLSSGTPGTISIQTPPSLTAPPSLAGGTPVATLSGNLTITPAPDGPSAFSLAADAGSVHVTATLSAGTTTFTVSGGTSATASVNANGDGTIRYASGATETILDYRITG